MMLRVAFALLAWVLLSAQTPMLPGFPPGTFQSRAALDAAGSVAVAPTLDGSAISSVGANNNTVTLSTTNAVDEIIVIAAVNGCSGGVDTIAAASTHLTFTFKMTSSGTISPPCAGNLLYEFYAQSTSPLISEVITLTVTPGAGVSYSEVMAFGVKNIKTSAPFDTNVSLPATALSGALNISTANATDFIFACFRSAGPTDSTWTAIVTGSFVSCEYLRTTVAQTGLAPGGTNGHNGAIGDALVSP